MIIFSSLQDVVDTTEAHKPVYRVKACHRPMSKRANLHKENVSRKPLATAVEQVSVQHASTMKTGQPWNEHLHACLSLVDAPTEENIEPNLLDREEIKRRVESVKQLLYGSLLSSRVELISTNHILGHLPLLVQQPLLLFLYKWSENAPEELSQVHYFDYEKTIIARGSRLLTFKTLTQQNEQLNRPEVVLDAEMRWEFFPIFVDLNSKDQFFLRVFRMDEATQNDSMFYEIRNPFNDVERPKLRTSNDFIAACCASLFSFNKRELKLADEVGLAPSLVPEVQRLVKIVFDRQRWEKDRGRRTRSSDPTTANDSAEYKDILENAGAFFADIRSPGGYLGRLYSRLRRPATTVKRLAAKAENKHQPSTANIFFAFRSYDRDEPRYETKGGKQKFSGFAHNLRFVLPIEQKQDWQRVLASEQRSRHDEAYPNVNPLKVGADKKSRELYDYRQLLQDLDDWFWIVVERDQELTDDKDKFKEIFDVLEAPIGCDALSFLEPVVYAGVPAYRYPFRRLAGLSRVRIVEESLRKFQSSNFDSDRSFGLQDLIADNAERLREAAIDLKRVVAIYYLLRALAPMIDSPRAQHRTTLLLIPVEVCGSIPAVIGTVFFKPEHEKFDELHHVLNDDASRCFDFVLHFYNDIFLPAARDIRRMYRDIQIDYVEARIAKVIQDLSQKSEVFQDEDDVVIAIRNCLREDESQLNLAMRRWARFIPYPVLKFKWESRDENRSLSANERAIKTSLDGWSLYINSSPNHIFRRDFIGTSPDTTEPTAMQSGEIFTPQASSDLDLVVRRIEAAIDMALIDNSGFTDDEPTKKTDYETKTV